MVIAHREPILFFLLFTFLLVVQVMDVVYTKEVITSGVAVESNPIAALLIDFWGWVGLLLFKTFPCIMGMIVSLFMSRTERWVKALVWLGVIAYVPLAAYHLYHIGTWSIL